MCVFLCINTWQELHENTHAYTHHSIAQWVQHDIIYPRFDSQCKGPFVLKACTKWHELHTPTVINMRFYKVGWWYNWSSLISWLVTRTRRHFFVCTISYILSYHSTVVVASGVLRDSTEGFVFFREVLILPLILSSASATSISTAGQWRDEQRNGERW